jgi:glycosyltransferase involved in cell wall biosynthesis
MRIGIDCRYLREAPRGVGHYLINTLHQIAQQKITNQPDAVSEDMFYLYSPGPILYKPQTENFVIRKGRFSLPGTFWFQIEGKNLIRSDRLDAFWAPCDILPAGLPKKIRKVLSILDLTHLYFPHTMENYNLLIHKLFFLSSLKNADHIITISNFIKQDLIMHFNIPSEKIITIYLGVDDKFHIIEKSKVLSVLNRYSINRPYILSVGTLEPKKNYIRLLNAYKALKTDLDLIIVGKKGWKANDIFKTIDSLGLKKRVKILGYIQNDYLPYLYNGAEVFIFPSLYEGFGLPLLEAMACGAPVICSNTSSLAEISGEAVLKFNPNSVDELVLRIEQLLNNSELKETLRNKGFTRAKQFSWDKTAQ